MMLSRRSVVQLGSIAALAAPGILKATRANAAQFTFRIGTDGPTSDPTVEEIVAAAAKVKERTSGAVEITIFPNSALGAGTSMIGPIRSGAVEGYYLTSAVLANVAPNAAISGIPFAFDKFESVWAAMDGKLGDLVKADLRAIGLEPFGKILDIGFRQTATTKRIDKVDDLEGVKLRVPQSPLYVGLFKALGTLPTPLSFAEVYPALQTKIVDGTECPLNVLVNSKLYEVAQFVAMTNHMWDGFWLTLNPAFLKKLSSAQYDIVLEEVNAAAERVRKRLLDDERKSTDLLKSKGITFTKPDPLGFRDKLIKKGFYTEWKAKMKPEIWAALEQAAGQTL